MDLHMNSLITIVFYAICNNVLSGTGLLLNDELQSDYHLPGKIILSNMIRQQNRPIYVQKLKSSHENLRETLDSNALTTFLNRFQPALDRETKRIVEKSADHHDTSPESQPRSKNFLKEPLWRATRDDHGARKVENKTTQCTRVPGKVMCKFGPYTYVINTRSRDIDNEELEKIVGMMHQRVQEGDKNFDLSIISPREKDCVALESAPEPFMLPEEGSVGFDTPPVIVECTPVDTPQTRFSGSDNLEEILYNCKWHSLKLKRDNKPKKISTDDETFIYATPVAKTCSTAVWVRKFSAACSTTSCPKWCPDTTLKPCTTSQLPYCKPWCNPFLKDSNNPIDKLVNPKQTLHKQVKAKQ